MFKYRVLQGFDAEGPGELSVSANDIVISKTDQDKEGWLLVKSLRGGPQEGFVPFAYLEFLSMQTQLTPSAASLQQQQNNSQSVFPAGGIATTRYGVTSNQYMQANQVPIGLEQPSFEQPPAAQYGYPSSQQLYTANPFEAGNNDPFSTISEMGSSLPGATALPLQKKAPSQETDASRRHSYAVGPVSQVGKGPAVVKSSTAGQRENQYSEINPTQFKETLELWRERERRFAKGEPERLPQAKRRVYFYWDRFGNRVGPLYEEEMKQRLESQQLSGDTPISLSIGNDILESVPLQQAFPDASSAFETAPLLSSSKGLLWVYRDDMGINQGPFPAKQMRDWFQEGYFNAETLVRLADAPDSEFVQLGMLFPEGEGAFLSAGDQAGAKQAMLALMDEDASQPQFLAPDGGMYLNNNSFDPNNIYGNPYEVPPPVDLSNNPYLAANPFGGDPYLVPPPAIDYSGYDASPYGAPDDGGKELLFSALGSPPPAIGGGGGAPPPALQPKDSEDWGITWDDEPEEAAAHQAASSQNAEDAIPLAIGHGPGDDGDDEHESPPMVTQFSELETKYLSSVESLYVFLTRSLPKQLGTVRCKVKRSVVGRLHVNYNLYELFLEREDGSLGPQILIAQKLRKYAVDAYYNIGIGSVNRKESGKVISCLEFNTLGTHFLCHNDVSAHKGKPRDLACVVYQRGIGKGPRKFQVALPAQKPGSEIEQVEWPHKGGVKKSELLKNLSSMDFNGLQPLVNKKPTWSRTHKSWTLNFHGRVKRSSVKNFQLVRPDDQKTTVLQFGRYATDTFTMDFSWPCSPVAAFAICVSSLHSKLAVE